jgi:hypothetical protein
VEVAEHAVGPKALDEPAKRGEAAALHLRPHAVHEPKEGMGGRAQALRQHRGRREVREELDQVLVVRERRLVSGIVTKYGE